MVRSQKIVPIHFFFPYLMGTIFGPQFIVLEALFSTPLFWVLFILHLLIGISWKIKLSKSGSVLTDGSSKKSHNLGSLLPSAVFLSIVFFIGSAFVTLDYKQRVSSWEPPESMQTRSNLCESQCKPSGSEALPKGVVRATSNLEMRPLVGPPNSSKMKGEVKPTTSLLAIAAGIKQKEVVNQIVKKFSLNDSAVIVMLLHYDGVVDEWRDLPWSGSALHVSAASQTKWWFAKRFLHPDIVAEYDYIFLWDDDLGVENFNPERYLSIVRREGLEISQPGLDPSNSVIHHPITARLSQGDCHRRTNKLNGGIGKKCYANSTGPPCTGWVEIMAPVFSRAAWRCAWHMIQNDLTYTWGLDIRLGYCAQGDRAQKVGVVDSEYIVHKGVPILGGSKDNKVSNGSPSPVDRNAVLQQSLAEMDIFKSRWRNAAADDKCWTDPYPDWPE